MNDQPQLTANLTMSRRSFTRAAACGLAAAGLLGSGVASRAVLASEAGDKAAALSFTPGTYTGTAVGNGGNIVVDVTFTDSAIESIEITSQSETPAVAAGALEELPKLIIEKQSLGIDGMTGATVTSAGIFNAVADAAEQAGADTKALYATLDEPKSTEVKELSADAVVVGGGAAGMAATVRLAELGKKVVLVEKTYRLGGCISVSGGNQVVMGSELQEQAGVSDDTPDSMVEDFQANGEDMCVPELIQLYAEHVGETTDWLNESCGVQYNVEAGLHDLAEYSHDRELAYVDGGYGASESLKKAVADCGADVLLDTSIQAITMADGAVAGIEAVAKDGTTYKISAPAVVLAAGGYGASQKWKPESLATSLYYGLTTSTGDGLTVATAPEVNAGTLMLEYAKQYPNGVEVSEGRAKSTIDGNLVVWPMSAILVSPEGKRVVNEKASNHDILEVELQQENATLYLLMDAENYAAWSEKLPGTGFNMDDVQKWLDANGTTTPVFAHDETVEGLAGHVNMDPEVLVETVDNYNAGVDAGVDEFGRQGDYLKMKIGEGEYYLVEQKPRYATTMGGLVINDQLQVEDADGNVIGGLYAAGEIVGGVMGSNSPSGANNGWALTSGKLAAESIANA